jgi:protein TonB
MVTPPHFKRLGIDPTEDVKVIKRAYALVLRTIDQQHEREAFEQLRRDYEQSIAWARNQSEKESEHEQDRDEDDDREDDDRQDIDIRLDADHQDRLDHDNGSDSERGRTPPIDTAAAPTFGALVPNPDPLFISNADPSAREPIAIPPVVSREPDPVPSANALPSHRDIDAVPSGHADSVPPGGIPLGGIPPHRADRTGPGGGEIDPPLPIPPAIASVDPVWASLAASRQAIDEWITRLFKSREKSLSSLLDEALRDERLAHLDSQSQLETQLAEALYKDPEGRAALFDAASQRFGWTSRHVTSIRDAAVAAWISKVINQDLQWHAQQSASRLAQDAALKTAMATGSPSNAAAYKFTPALDQMQDTVPQWLALRISAQRLREWHNAHSAISKNWLRWTAVKQHFAPKPPKPRQRFKLTRKVVLTILVSFGVVGLILSATEGSPPGAPNAKTQTPDQNAAAAAAAKAPSGPVLAYEFTGPVTKDSCDDAHEFIHESNWLEVKDASANALLTTRVLLCQDQKLWPLATDPLLTCLRAERLAALSAGRPEDNQHCQPPDAGKK